MISIVFITCNRSEELRVAILSCLGKTDEGFEVIVIDNNSTDNTRDMCAALSLEHQFDLHYTFNERNSGVSASRNQGFRLAKGDIVYFLDDDALLQSEGRCLSEVARFMRMNPHYGAVATEIYNTTFRYYQHGAFAKEAGRDKGGEVFHFVGASHFINKGALGIESLYPDEFFYGGEEYYFSYYLHSIGLKVYYYKNLLVHHIPSVNNRMSFDEIMINNYCNVFNVKRYFSPAAFQPLIWMVMIGRMTFSYRKKPHLYKVFFRKIRDTYNSAFSSPMPNPQFIRLMRVFGVRIIL